MSKLAISSILYCVLRLVHRVWVPFAKCSNEGCEAPVESGVCLVQIQVNNVLLDRSLGILR